MVFPAQVIIVISHGFERVGHQSGRMVNTFCMGWVQCFWWPSVWLLRSSTSLPSTGWSTRTPFGTSPLCLFHFFGVFPPLLSTILTCCTLGSVSLLPMRYFMKSEIDSKSRKLNDRELQGFSTTNKDDLLCGCGFGDARAHSQLHKEPTKWFTEWDMISIKSN